MVFLGGGGLKLGMTDVTILMRSPPRSSQISQEGLELVHCPLGGPPPGLRSVCILVSPDSSWVIPPGYGASDRTKAKQGHSQGPRGSEVSADA